MSKISVIIATYNNFDALVNTLHGYEVQTEKDFDIVIADDGSNDSEVSKLKQYLERSSLKVVHSWIPDEGFQKCKALNEAVRKANSEYLLFTDADIIPRKDFIEKHLRLRRPNFFISGGSHIDCSEKGVSLIEPGAISSNEIFTIKYWQDRNLLSKKMRDRFEVSGIREQLKNLLAFRIKTFNGSNAACWKEDFIAVNGFDEEFGYGGLDIDFGLRLSNYGVKSRRYSYSLIALHQWHKHPYRNPEQVKKNKHWMRSEHRNGRCYVKHGYNHNS